jgi:L-ribulose-5-phosphate 4-epimerase
MLEKLKSDVLEANLELEKKKLVIYTWGNVSGIDRKKSLVVIKPSGVPYDSLNTHNMSVIDLDGNIVEGKLKPSSDYPTHLELYKAFPSIGGIAHTHSTFATSWAQAASSIPPFGTTHADYFYGSIPCTRKLTRQEIENDYEKNTGKLITETFKDIDYLEVPGVLVSNHGPFTWGKDAGEAVYNSVVFEKIAEIGLNTIRIDNSSTEMQTELLDKHFLRKHGKNAYYGQ